MLYYYAFALCGISYLDKFSIVGIFGGYLFDDFIVVCLEAVLGVRQLLEWRRR